MQLSEILVGLGDETFADMLKTVSIGKLKTFQLFERIKTRCHLAKLNTETLRKAAPRLFERIKEGDQDLTTELCQAILICHMDLIVDVLNFLEVPHEEGFFAKDQDVSAKLTGDWQERAYKEFSGKYPRAAVLLYLNHLAWEMTQPETVFNAA